MKSKDNMHLVHMKYKDCAVPYYRLIIKDTMADFGFYSQFVNWVCGELDLYLQDKTSGLKVYVPNGFFCIDMEFKPNSALEVIVFNKSKVECKKIYAKVVEILNHLKQLQSSNQ